MDLRRVTLLLAVAVLLVVGTASKEQYIVERWKEPEFEHRRFEKVIVVGITDDDRARRDFENLFVTQLRGRHIEAITSYSLVPDLADDDEGMRQMILEAIETNQIDGVISVRVVPLKKLTDEEWSAAWQQKIDDSQTLRQLIEETLPVAPERSGKYGLEIALWGVRESSRVWAARTTPYTVKQMRNGASDFVQYTMHALEVADLMKGTNSPR